MNRLLSKGFLLVCLFVTASGYAQPLYQWADVLPGFSVPAISAQNQVADLFINRQGDVYVIGSGYLGLDMDPGPATDSLVLSGTSSGYFGKYSSTGALIWKHRFALSGGATACTITDSGMYYLAGQIEGTDTFSLTTTTDTASGSGVFIAKYDSLDNLIWVRTTPMPQGVVTTIKTDASGNVFFGGSFFGTWDVNPENPGFLTFISSLKDGYVAKYTAGGHFVWARQVKGGDGDAVAALCIDQSGNIATTGYTAGLMTSSGSFGDTGSVMRTLHCNGGYDAFVTKYNTNGAILWMKAIGGAGDDFPACMLIDKQGDIYTGGLYEHMMIADTPSHDTLNVGSNTSGYLVELDKNGNFVWARNYGPDSASGKYGRVSALAKDDTGNVYMAGAFQEKVLLNPAGPAMYQLGGTPGYLFMEYYVMKMDSGHNYKWALHTYSKGDDIPYTIQVDTHHNIYVGGYITDTTDFNLDGTGGKKSFPKPNPNWTPVSFVVKYAQETKTNIVTLTENASYKVYPNPTHDMLTVETGGDEIQATIYDVAGRALMLPYMRIHGKLQINTTSLASGVYILRCTGNNSCSFKIIKD